MFNLANIGWVVILLIQFGNTKSKRFGIGEWEGKKLNEVLKHTLRFVARGTGSVIVDIICRTSGLTRI